MSNLLITHMDKHTILLYWSIHGLKIKYVFMCFTELAVIVQHHNIILMNPASKKLWKALLAYAQSTFLHTKLFGESRSWLQWNEQNLLQC